MCSNYHHYTIILGLADFHACAAVLAGAHLPHARMSSSS